MKNAIALIGISAILFASCSTPKTYFNSAVRTQVERSAIPLEKLQFYVDRDVEIRREVASSSAKVSSGIIKLENGFTIYHMGDTNVFSDMKLIADYYKPDLLLIPIGGWFVMDPKEAALATKFISPKYAIPIHYGTTPQLKGTPQEYLAALGKTKSKTKVIVMQPGQTHTF